MVLILSVFKFRSSFTVKPLILPPYPIRLSVTLKPDTNSNTNPNPTHLTLLTLTDTVDPVMLKADHTTARPHKHFLRLTPVGMRRQTTAQPVRSVHTFRRLHNLDRSKAMAISYVLTMYIIIQYFVMKN